MFDKFDHLKHLNIFMENKVYCNKVKRKKKKEIGKNTAKTYLDHI